MVWGVKQKIWRLIHVFFIISYIQCLETVRTSQKCPPSGDLSAVTPLRRAALTSKASLYSELCDVMRREARSSRWDEGAQQASAHRVLTTTMTTSWCIKKKFFRTLRTFVLRQHWLSSVCGALTDDEMVSSQLTRDLLRWRFVVWIQWYLLILCDSYNLDVEHPLVFNGPNGSLFGYSVLLHQHADDTWWVLQTCMWSFHVQVKGEWVSLRNKQIVSGVFYTFFWDILFISA